MRSTKVPSKSAGPKESTTVLSEWKAMKQHQTGITNAVHIAGVFDKALLAATTLVLKALTHSGPAQQNDNDLPSRRYSRLENPCLPRSLKSRSYRAKTCH